MAQKIMGRGGKGGGGKQFRELPNTLRATSIQRVLDLISEGEIGGLVDGLKSIYLDGVPVQASDGTMNVSGFTYQENKGAPDQSFLPGFPAVEQEVPVGVEVTNGGNHLANAIVRRVNELEATAVRFLMVIPALNETFEKDAEMRGASVSFAFDVRPQAESGGAWQFAIAHTITGKTTSEFPATYRVDLPGEGPWDIRVRRLTPDSEQVKLNNSSVWASYTVLFDHKLSYPNSALIGSEIDAQFFGSNVPVRSYDVYGLICRVPTNYDPVARTYTGLWNGQWKWAWTNNPVWVLFDILTRKRYGIGLPDVRIDKWTLYQAAQYCDELVPDGFGGMEPRFLFNGVVNAQEDAYTVVQSIASSFRAMSYWGSGQFSLSQDRPKAVRKSFTPANVLGGNFEYSGTGLDTRHTVAIVKWWNPERGYQQDFEVVEDREAIALYGYKPTEVTAYGCTSRGQARRFGLWTLLTEKVEKDSVTFGTGYEGQDLMPGEIIDVADPAFAGVRLGGRVRSVPDLDTLVMDAAFDFKADETYTVSLAMQDGTLVEYAVANAPGLSDTIDLVLPLPAEGGPEAGAVYTLRSNKVSPRAFRVMLVGESDQPDQAQIMAVAYEGDKFPAVDEDFRFDVNPANRYRDLPSPTFVPAPRNVAISFMQRRVAYGSQPFLQIDWQEAPDARLINGYDVAYKRNDDNWVYLPLTSGTNAEIPNPKPGTYTVRVTAVNNFGLPSAAVSATYDMAPLASATGKDLIRNLQLDQGGFQFTGPDATVQWEADAIGGATEDDDTGVDEFFQTFRVTVRAQGGTVLRVEDTRERTYTYTVEKNQEDGAGRAFSVGVRTVARDATVSNEVVANLSNPAPVISPAPTFSATPGRVAMAFKTPLDPDFLGVRVWMGTASGFTPTDSNLEWDGAGNPRVEAVPGSTVHLKWAAYDAFGQATIQGPVQVQVPLITSGDLDDQIITTEKIANEAVIAGKLALNAVTEDKIAALAVVAAKIAENAVTTAKISDNAITQGKIAANAVGQAQIQALAINASKIAENAITTEKLATDAVTQAKLAANAVGAPQIQALAVTEAKVADNAITVSKIGTGAVTLTKFASGLTPVEVVSSLPTTGNFTGRTAVLTTDGKLYRYTGGAWTAAINAGDISGEIAAAQIASLAASQITGQLTDNQIAAIGAAKLTGQITGTQISDNAITTPKIAAGAVTAGEIAAGSIVADKIAANAVTAAKIEAGAITTAKLDAGAVTAAKIAALSITAAQIAANAITSDKITANAITTAKLAAGAVTATEIQAGAITASKLLIGDRTNMIPDGDLLDPSAWNMTGGWTISSDPNANMITERFARSEITLSGGANNQFLGGMNPNTFWPVRPGDRIYARARSRTAGTAVGRVQMRVSWFDKAGAALGGEANVFSRLAPYTSPVEDSIIATAPADAAYARFRLRRAADTDGNSSGWMAVWDMEMRRAADGSLIVDGAITADKIGVNAITATKIDAGAVTADKILAGAVTTLKLAAGAVTADRIAANTITAAQIAANTVTAAQIAALTITASEIAVGAITADKILAGAITTVKLAAGAVTAAKITANTITAAQIAAGTITAAEIAALTITASEIQAGAITTAKILAGAVTADQLAANSVVAAKIAAGAIQAISIASGAVTTAKLDALAVTADKIAANAITAAKIAAGAITADKIAANAITADKIQAGSITGSRISSTTAINVGSGASLGGGLFDRAALLGEGSSANPVRFHAGHTSPTESPFQVDRAGNVVARKLTIYTPDGGSIWFDTDLGFSELARSQILAQSSPRVERLTSTVNSNTATASFTLVENKTITGKVQVNRQALSVSQIYNDGDPVPADAFPSTLTLVLRTRPVGGSYTTRVTKNLSKITSGTPNANQFKVTTWLTEPTPAQPQWGEPGFPGFKTEFVELPEFLEAEFSASFTGDTAGTTYEMIAELTPTGGLLAFNTKGRTLELTAPGKDFILDVGLVQGEGNAETLQGLGPNDFWRKTEITPVSEALTLSAGNGLTGGGNLTTNRTFTLGTPGTVGNGSTNSVQASSHTHAISLGVGDIPSLPISKTTGLQGALDGKAASSHNHAWSDLTSGVPATATRWPTWSEVTSKPTTFSPSAHTHAWGDIISGVPDTATRWPTWTEVTSKPTTFAPSAHTHSAADITSGTINDARLPGTMSGKTFSGPLNFNSALPGDTYAAWGNGFMMAQGGSPFSGATVAHFGKSSIRGFQLAGSGFGARRLWMRHIHSENPNSLSPWTKLAIADENGTAFINDREVFRLYDQWLRVNMGNAFSNGTFHYGHFRMNPSDTIGVGTSGATTLGPGGLFVQQGSQITHGSDARLKNRVRALSRGVDLLRPVDFNWIKGGKADFGFIAQEVQKHFPEAVSVAKDGTLGVDYGKLVTVAVAGAQEALSRIESLEARLARLEALLGD
jgi:predicted phage tail protein